MIEILRRRIHITLKQLQSDLQSGVDKKNPLTLDFMGQNLALCSYKKSLSNLKTFITILTLNHILVNLVITNLQLSKNFKPILQFHSQKKFSCKHCKSHFPNLKIFKCHMTFPHSKKVSMSILQKSFLKL